jgi:hypothetical protein
MAVLLALHTRQGAKKNHVLSRLLIYFLNREENLPHFLEVPQVSTITIKNANKLCATV